MKTVDRHGRTMILLEPTDCVYVGDPRNDENWLEITYTHPMSITVQDPGKPMVRVRASRALVVVPAAANTVGIEPAELEDLDL